jgi:hypothetical protein
LHVEAVQFAEDRLGFPGAFEFARRVVGVGDVEQGARRRQEDRGHVSLAARLRGPV